jgi:hypothetical protein
MACIPPEQIGRQIDMSKGNTWENDLLKLIFNATAIANIADNAASSPITTLWVSLHDADPGEAGNQSTNEVASPGDYASYDRVAVARNSGGWTVTGNSVSPVADIVFAPGEPGDGVTITHFGIGTASSSSGKLLYSGAVTPNIVLAEGVIPRFTSGSTITED